MRWRFHAVSFLFCLVTVVLFLWPELPPWHYGTLLYENLDGRLLAWVFAWDRAWLLGLGEPGRLLFDAPIFYPSTNTLAYSEHCLGLLPATLALWPILGEAGLVFHAQLILGYSLSAYSTLWLADRITRSRLVAFSSAILWLWSTPHLIDHPRFIFHLVWGVSFLFLGLDGFCRLTNHRRWAWLALAAAGAVGQGLVSWYMAQHVGWAVLAFLMVYPLFAPGKGRKAILGSGLVSLLFLGALIPLLAPYMEIKDDQILATSSMLRNLSLSPEKAFFPGHNDWYYVGLFRFVLALTGFAWCLVYWRKWSRPTKRWILLLTIFCGVSFTLAFGPSLVWRDSPVAALPYEVLRRLLPQLQAFRILNRWIAPASIGMAIFGGMAVRVLYLQASRRSLLAAQGVLCILAGILILDTWHIDPSPRCSPQTLDADIVAFLNQCDSHTVVADLTGPWRETDAMIRQTTHWLPIIQGYSGYSPTRYYGTVGPLLNWPSEASSHVLAELGVDLVIAPTRQVRQSNDIFGEIVLNEAMFCLIRPDRPVAPPSTESPEPRNNSVTSTAVDIPIDQLKAIGFMKTAKGHRTVTYDSHFLFSLTEPINPEIHRRLLIEFSLLAEEGNQNVSQLFWATESEPVFDEYRSIRVPYRYAERQTIEFHLGELPGWKFEVPPTRFRWDPVGSEGVTINIDRILFSP